MPTAITLLFALACRAPYQEASQPHALEDTACSPDSEVPYDGVDQDCDGADLVDADGDGFDVDDDCDDNAADVFPGAEETPWDGIDQDCDGRDLCDADGDGFDAEACGGSDCDDEDVAAFPGAGEVLADGDDDDCDGRVDEVEACIGGTGHYLTLQEAVDAAPDGGVVEVCPGVWTESVVLQDRILTLAGGGETPRSSKREMAMGSRWRERPRTSR